MLTPAQSLALRQIARAAVASERQTKCPAELTAAQCILESGWLANAPGQNCFGIKASMRHRQTQTLMTIEVLRRDQMQPDDVILEVLPDGRVRVRGARIFAAYPTLGDCLVDHARLIVHGKPYQQAWQQYQKDGDRGMFMARVAREYATDPQYLSKLQSILAMLAVKDALATASNESI